VIAVDDSSGTTEEAWEVGNDAAAGEETWLPGSTSEPVQLLAVITATNMVRRAPDLFASDIALSLAPHSSSCRTWEAGRYVPDMQVTISIPQLDSGTFDTQGVKAYLARAEELGFEAGWVMEQSIGPTPLIAPLEMLAYAAACTERLRLGVAVLVSSLHDPLQLASAVTAVDRLSHGRLEVGVSPGGGFRDFASFGVDRRTFVARFTEGLQLMKAAWSDEPRLTFRGQFRQLDDVPIQPKPTQRPHPPIWFGGSAPKALARAVRHGDGFLGAGSSTTESFIRQVGIIRGELDEQGRDRAGFAIGKRVYLAVDDDAERARTRVLDGLRRLYGAMPGIENVPVFGTPEDVVRGLREVKDAGAEMIVLNPLGADVDEDREQMERLAADVVSHLR
jgi:alkanesulfonate monooxygenase SsuD/methylene tetrahydromethanopterin reductase-like flavin-dependent oxidoreductase (luciferase family)